MPLNLADLFFAQAEKNPDQPVILGPQDHDRIPYGQLAGNIRQLAKQLQRVGVCQGMNIGLHCPSGGEYISLTYAVWVCGGTVTPVPMELADKEKQQILRHICIDAVISTESRASGAALFAAVGQADALADAEALTEDTWFLKVIPQREPPPELKGLNPAFIRFTSGTTGAAKGVVLSHETIFERIRAANQGLGIGPGDRIVWLLSMAYHFAVSIVAYLSFGATIILPKNAFGVSILRAAMVHQATMIYASPTHYELMIHDRSGQALPPLRLAIATTTRLAPELAQAFYHRFALPLNETYGIIEIGLPAVNLDQPWEKRGSVGRPLPAYTVTLARPSEETTGETTRQTVRQTAGQTAGEILIKGPGLLDAYYDPWRRRDQILREHGGWLATGDLGVMDDQGFLTISGRSKEMICVAGMKFFPQEVEAVLARHPSVEEACVSGITAPRLGEAPMALLVGAKGVRPADDSELKAHCSRYLAGYKIPVQFQWVSSLARTGSGKIIRNAGSR